MRRGAITLLTLAATALALAGACRRRPANGACTAHIDCAAGYDCRDRRCVKRPPVPGTVVEPAAEAPAVPVPPPPLAPAPTAEPPAPAMQEEAPRRPKPPRPESTPQENSPAPPPENLPMWKARLKDS